MSRWALRFLWLAVAPALISALVVRNALPTVWEARDTWAEPWARWADGHLLWVWAVLLVLWAGLIQYWRAWLPGGRYAGSLPTPLAARTPRTELGDVEAAMKWYRAGRRAFAREATEAPPLALVELEGAIMEGDLRQRALAMSRVRELVPSARSAKVKAALSLALAIGAAATVAWVTRTSVASTYEVLGGSMLPSLEPGDLLLGNRTAYGLRLAGTSRTLGARVPQRGDVVVVQNPKPDEGAEHLVKRIIGLPGDRIQMQGNIPVINGWQVPGCDAGYYLHASHELGAQGRVYVEFLEDRAYLALYSAAVPPFVGSFTVPAGEVFVLGDNRANSIDSRAWNEGKGGSLPLTQIDARAWRFLTSRTLDDRTDLAMFMQPIELYLHFAPVDARELRDGIAACLRQRPSDTTPPKPASSTTVATSPLNRPPHAAESSRAE